MELLERKQRLAELTDWLRRAIEGPDALLCLARKPESARPRCCRNSPRRRSVRGRYGAVAMRCSAPRPLGPLYDIARQTQGELLAAIYGNANREAIFCSRFERA